MHDAQPRAYYVFELRLSDIKLGHGLYTTARIKTEGDREEDERETDAIALWLKITVDAEAVNFVFHDPRRFRILQLPLRNLYTAPPRRWIL